MPYPSKDALERAKLTVDLLAPFVLILVLVIALLNAQSIVKLVGSTLEAARIEVREAEFFGVRFAARQTDEKRDLNRSLVVMVKRHTETLDLLKCQRDRSCGATETAQIAELLDGPPVPQAVIQTLAASKTAVAANEKAISKAEAAQPAKAGDDWIVIVGADPNTADAYDEVKRLAKIYPEASVETLLRGSWYRTVVHFPTAAEAQRNVAKIAAATKRTPYARRLSDWCATVTPVPDGPSRCEVPTGP